MVLAKWIVWLNSTQAVTIPCGPASGTAPTGGTPEPWVWKLAPSPGGTWRNDLGQCAHTLTVRQLINVGTWQLLYQHHLSCNLEVDSHFHICLFGRALRLHSLATLRFDYCGAVIWTDLVTIVMHSSFNKSVSNHYLARISLNTLSSCDLYTSLPTYACSPFAKTRPTSADMATAIMNTQYFRDRHVSARQPKTLWIPAYSEACATGSIVQKIWEQWTRYSASTVHEIIQ